MHVRLSSHHPPPYDLNITRALDDDHAAYKLALALKKPDNITSFLLQRSFTAPFTLYNSDTGFMEAKNANGTLAGPDNGWTEGSLVITSLNL